MLTKNLIDEMRHRKLIRFQYLLTLQTHLHQSPPQVLRHNLIIIDEKPNRLLLYVNSIEQLLTILKRGGNVYPPCQPS